VIPKAKQLRTLTLIASLAPVAWMALTPKVVSAGNIPRPCRTCSPVRSPIRVPEPSTLLMVGASVSALASTAFLLRRRRK
jgi:hypothetical protein